MTGASTTVTPLTTDAPHALALQRALASGDAQAAEAELRRLLQCGLAIALSAVAQLTELDGPQRDDLRSRCVALFVRTHPGDSRPALVELFGTPLPPSVADARYATLATVRPAEVLAPEVLALPRSDEQFRAARHLVETWAHVAPEAALDWSARHRGVLDDAAMAALVAAAGKHAPRAALEFLLRQEHTFEQPLRWEIQVSELVARNATESDPGALLVWAAELPLPPTAWNNLVRQTVRHLERRDPTVALAFAHAVPDPHLQSDLVGLLARGEWVHAHATRHGLAALAELFRDPGHQSAAVQHAVELARAASPELLPSLLQRMPDGPAKRRALAAAAGSD